MRISLTTSSDFTLIEGFPRRWLAQFQKLFVIPLAAPDVENFGYFKNRISALDRPLISADFASCGFSFLYFSSRAPDRNLDDHREYSMILFGLTGLSSTASAN